MYSDPRGGHNRKNIDETFFKAWSPQMAYVLGLIFADGALIDARKSSRTCYFTITSKDKSLLNQIRKSLSSSHVLYERGPHLATFKSYGVSRSYMIGTTFCLRIGSKIMYTDLLKLGLSPRKSLTMKLPVIPTDYFPFFVRGYFDGDGCITSYVKPGQIAHQVSVIFTSGSKEFLVKLGKKFTQVLGIKRKVYKSDHAFQLAYRKRDSLQLMAYIYENLEASPYLSRKYQRYKSVA